MAGEPVRNSLRELQFSFNSFERRWILELDGLFAARLLANNTYFAVVADSEVAQRCVQY